MELEQILNIAFCDLQRTYRVRKVNKLCLKKNNIPTQFVSCEAYWEVTKEIELNSVVYDFVFYVLFQNDFPFSLPKIYLSDKSYEQVKYIPHLDTNKLLCTYSDNVLLDSSKPVSIIRSCLTQARRIIETGVNLQNLSDFETEFFAYWNNSYSQDDRVDSRFVFWEEKEERETRIIEIIELLDNSNRFKYFIILNEVQKEKVLEYVRTINSAYAIFEALYISEKVNNFIPPFNTSFYKLENMFKNHQVMLKKFFTSKNKKNIIVTPCKIGNHKKLIGWEIPGFDYLFKNSTITGFRKEKITSYELLTKYYHKDIKRILCEDFSQQRLLFRSEGSNDLRSRTFCIAGLGSIGSNLIPFLNSFSFPNFKLVDYDILSVENSGRHLAGFEDIGANKTIAIKRYLHARQPFQNVEIKDCSIIELIRNDLDFINSTDFLFVAIGNQNIEKEIIKFVADGLIIKPIFILWVESYLVGGHCIYISPNSKIDISNLYRKEFYLNSIIDEKEYESENDKLFLKEAGCHTDFIPYSQSNIILFLSRIFIEINIIIKENSCNSKCITWCGDKTILTNKNIQISTYGQLMNYGDIKIDQL